MAQYYYHKGRVWDIRHRDRSGIWINQALLFESEFLEVVKEEDLTPVPGHLYLTLPFAAFIAIPLSVPGQWLITKAKSFYLGQVPSDTPPNSIEEVLISSDWIKLPLARVSHIINHEEREIKRGGK